MLQNEIAQHLGVMRKKKSLSVSGGQWTVSDTVRTDTLALVTSLLTEAETRKKTRESLSDDEVVSQLRKMVSQRETVAQQYEDAGRPEKAQRERDEAAVISEFVPQLMDEDATRNVVAEVIAETGATSMKDMGKVMGALKKYDVDMGLASSIVKEML